MTSPEEFRLATRSWLEENCPDSARGPGPVAGGGSKVPIDADSALWLERCAQRGWTVPIWPTQYGGAGLSMDEYLVLLAEMQRIKAR
jgi:acyl-CoA dehydrogenase